MIGPILGGVAPVVYKTANTVMVFDGNSLVFGVGSTGGQNLPVQQAALAPISGALTITNTAVSGQTINDMRARGDSVVDPVFAAAGSKSKVLALWEGTNSISNTPVRTGLEAIADMTAYIAERRAAIAGLKIVLLTTIPRYFMNGTTIQNGNAQLLVYNNYILANYRDMGADAVVDVRTNPVFVYPAGATTMPSYMTPYSSDGHTHLNNAGYALVAAMVAAALRRLPKR